MLEGGTIHTAGCTFESASATVSGEAAKQGTQRTMEYDPE